MGDLLLEPESFGLNGDGGIGDGRDVFGAAEDIDDVDGFGNVFDAGIGFLTEDFGFVGVDGDDFVAGGLQVGGYFVGGASGIGGEADHRNGLGLAQEIGDWIRSGGRVVGEVEEHGVGRVSVIGCAERTRVTRKRFKSSKKQEKEFTAEVAEVHGVHREEVLWR